MILERFKKFSQYPSLPVRLGNKILPFHDPYNLKARGGRNRVMGIGMPMAEVAAALPYGLNVFASASYRRDGKITSSEALAHDEKVGLDLEMLKAEPSSGPAHAAHHLIQNEKDSVFLAYLGYDIVVASRRHDRSQGCPAYGLGQKCRNRVAPLKEYCILQRMGAAKTAGRIIQAVKAPQAVRRRDVHHIPEHGEEMGAHTGLSGI